MKKMVLAVCCCAALLGGCGDRYEAKSGLTPYKEEIFAMDTFMDITAYGDHASTAVEAASAEIQRLDELLSVTGESGDVYQLNQLGQRQVEADTLAVISRAAEVSKETDGLFDCTITPVMKLWGFRDGNFHVPTSEELTEQLAKVDGSKVHMEGNTVTLLDGVTVDLGAIAKGYTSQRIMEIYQENGVTSGIVSLGGKCADLRKEARRQSLAGGFGRPQKSRGLFRHFGCGKQSSHHFRRIPAEFYGKRQGVSSYHRPKNRLSGGKWLYFRDHCQ